MLAVHSPPLLSDATIDAAAAATAAALRCAKHCVLFTGAGISTSSGIGDYRGKVCFAHTFTRLWDAQDGKWTQEETGIATGDAGVPYECMSFRQHASFHCHPSIPPSLSAAAVVPARGCRQAGGAGLAAFCRQPSRPLPAPHALSEHRTATACICCRACRGPASPSCTVRASMPGRSITCTGNIYIESCVKCGHEYERNFYVMDDDV